MGLKTTVKLSQVTNLSDARYAAGMGVQLIGFNINPDSEYYVDPDKFNEITGWISGVDVVGEFDGEVFSFSVGYEFEYVQIMNPEFVSIVKDMEKKVIFEVNLDTHNDEAAEALMLRLKPEVDYFLLSGHTKNINPPKLKSWAKAYPVLLGFGVSEENIETLLQEYDIKGISIIGGEEKVVGFKDYDQLAGILEAVQSEDH